LAAAPFSPYRTFSSDDQVKGKADRREKDQKISKGHVHVLCHTEKIHADTGQDSPGPGSGRGPAVFDEQADQGHHDHIKTGDKPSLARSGVNQPHLLE